MKTINLIEQFFSNLDEWRHLPSYQLERRADILFSLYLPAFLENRFQQTAETIIPEFPVHIGTINPKIKTDRSFKIDYLVKMSGQHVFFVELKTEMASKNKKQEKYLQHAKKVGLPALTRGILKIFSKTQAKKKYQHLLNLLIDAHFLDSKLVVNKDESKVTILFLQPRSSDSIEQEATFAEFADFVSTYSDPLSQRFAQSLKLWGSTQAGEDTHVAA